MNRFVSRAALALLAVGAIVPTARAEQITYTEEGIFSGIYGGSTFTDLLVSISATADTADVQMIAPGVFAVDVTHKTKVTVENSGIGTELVIGEAVSVFDIQADMTAGFIFGGGEEVGTIGPEFASYDLSTAIGPVTGTAVNFGLDFFTNFGRLRLTKGTAPTTFTESCACRRGEHLGYGERAYGSARQPSVVTGAA
jgi:hypothetical protein